MDPPGTTDADIRVVLPTNRVIEFAEIRTACTVIVIVFCTPEAVVAVIEAVPGDLPVISPDPLTDAM